MSEKSALRPGGLSWSYKLLSPSTLRFRSQAHAQGLLRTQYLAGMLFLLSSLSLPAGYAQTAPAPANDSLSMQDISNATKAITEDSPGAPVVVPNAKAIAQADSSSNTAGSNVAAANGKPKSAAGKIGQTIKANIVETFQLDPRLQKDLTDRPILLSPIRLIQDNFSSTYNPSITWEKSPGSEKWPTTYEKRNMALYLVGPLTKHESVWLQLTPVSGAHGFFQNWELLKGVANYGTDKTFLQLNGGLIFNWQNAGFGGADRSITQSSPGVYSAFNGFDPTANSRGASLEATGLNWTTGKIFAYVQQPPTGTSSDPNIQYNRGYGGGLSLEKLFGKEGISGIQSNLTVGSTNLFNSNTCQNSQVAQYNANQSAQNSTNQANAALQAQADQANQAQVASDLANGIDPDTAASDGQAAAQAVIDGAGGFSDPVAAGQAAAANLPSVPIGRQTSPFVWWTSWINHSYQDKEGYIRLNPSFGVTTFEVKRYNDDPGIPEQRSKGYGYTFDVMAIPVRSYWTTILRMDAFNSSDLIHRNTQYTFTVGNAWDLHCGNKSKIRLTLDYQVVGQQGTTADQRFILGFWPIW